MKYLIGFMTIMILVLSSCQKKEIKNPDRDLVDVNGITLDKAVFINRFRLTKEFVNSKQITSEQVKKFIDEFFVSDFLLVNEAIDQGIDKDSAVVADLERLKVRAMTGMNGPLYRKVMAKPAKVSEEEVKALYDRSDYGVKIAYIRLSSKHIADSIYNALKHGANFAEMAKKHSLDVQTFEHGGEVRNYLYPGLLGKNLEDVIFSLKKDQISKPVFSSGWYYIIKALNTKKMKLKSFDEEKNGLRRKVQQVKENLHRNNYIDSLFIRYHFNINKSLFTLIRKAFVPYDRVGQIDVKKIPRKDWNIPLVTYDGGKFTLGQFVSLYNQSGYASRVPLKYEDEIVNHIKTLVIPYLMYQDGLQMGLQNSDQFKFIYERLRIDKLKRAALMRLVNSKIKITEDEVKNYYDQHKRQWNNQPFAKVERYVHNRLMVQKAKEYKQELVKKLRKKYDVIYNEPLISAVVDSLNSIKKNASPNFKAPNFRRK